MAIENHPPETQKGGRVMQGSPIQAVDMAKRISKNMSALERLDLAVELALTVTDPAMISPIKVASDKIGQHAHMMAREHIPQRSDGSFIHPYAPDGGPLRVRVEAKSESVGFFDLEAAKNSARAIRPRLDAGLTSDGGIAGRSHVVNQGLEVHPGPCFALLKHRLHLALCNFKRFIGRPVQTRVGGDDVR